MSDDDVIKGDWIVRRDSGSGAYLSLVTGVRTTFHGDGRAPDVKLEQVVISVHKSVQEATAAASAQGAERVLLREGAEYQLQEAS